MDGELVSGSLSSGAGRGADATSPRYTYTEIFKKCWPYYLSIGMSYDEYWRGPAELPKYYREAHELKIERENVRDWRMGLYFRDAIMACMPFPVGFAKGGARPKPYPDKPYPISVKQTNAQEQARQTAQYERMKSKMMAKMKAHNAKYEEVK